MQIHSVGIDLGKTSFHLVALGEIRNTIWLDLVFNAESLGNPDCAIQVPTRVAFDQYLDVVLSGRCCLNCGWQDLNGDSARSSSAYTSLECYSSSWGLALQGLLIDDWTKRGTRCLRSTPYVV